MSADPPAPSPPARRLFGTDGIRGRAGEFPMDAATMRRLGAFLTQRLRNGSGSSSIRVLIGRDTRESGPSLEAAFAEGVRLAGGEAHVLGVLPTAGLAFLTRGEGFSAGAMISASHNPWLDNGIKIFSGDGFKLADETEADMEAELLSSRPAPEAPGGSLHQRPELAGRYAAWLASQCRRDISGLPLALDCAHGAASALAGAVFSQLGTETRLYFASPDGRNINESCGAVHPEALREILKQAGAPSWGAALDGDADRAVFVTASGRLADGDDVLYLLSAERRRENLPGCGAVVGTVMSNAALEAHFRREGVAFHRAAVGDRYVLELMRRHGAALGGEPSGHILMLDLLTTGSGLLTVLKVAECLARRGQTLDEALSSFVKFPQTLTSRLLRERRPMEGLPRVQEALRRAEAALRPLEGRVVLRYSGTEAKVRIMTESPDAALNERLAAEMTAAFRAEGLLEN